MRKNLIKTNEFLERLTVVYGDEASAQQERFFNLAESFEKDFGCEADIRFFSAPGRTEVGGNHTDHNNGKVLAAAINLDAIAAVEARDDGIICVNSQGYAPITVDTANLEIVDDEAEEAEADPEVRTARQTPVQPQGQRGTEDAPSGDGASAPPEAGDHHSR